MNEKRIYPTNLPLEMTAFTLGLITAMGLPQSVLDKTRSGLYLQIDAGVKFGEISEITLCRAQGNEEDALIKLNWRRGERKYVASTSITRPLKPMAKLLGSVFPAGEKSAAVNHSQALMVVYTMMKYLETAR